MPTHRPILSIDEIYHVFNKTIGKEVVFSFQNNLKRILETVNYYRYFQQVKFSKFQTFSPDQQDGYLKTITKKLPLVEIYVFSFMPNHFHFLLKQLQDQGTSKFLSDTQNSFAKYYNLKNDRDGGLFLNNFKAKRIRNNEEFIHVSRYIHLNHTTSGIIKFEQLSTYEWTSLPCYLNKNDSLFINTKPILSYYITPQKYLKFLSNQVDYQRKLKLIKQVMTDEPKFNKFYKFRG